MSNLYREPVIYASYQVRFIWPSGFRGEDFCRNRPITLKRNYGSVFLTQNYELQFSFNVIITITYSTLCIINSNSQFPFFFIKYVVSIFNPS